MPQRGVEKQLARRKLIYECRLLGIKDNPGILVAYMAGHGVKISEKTMIKDPPRGGCIGGRSKG